MRRPFRHICATEVVVMCWSGVPPGKSQCPGLSIRHHRIVAGTKICQLSVREGILRSLLRVRGNSGRILLTCPTQADGLWAVVRAVVYVQRGRARASPLRCKRH